MMLPANVRAVKDRHGKTRYRFRKKGYPSRYVLGEPGSADFLLSYEDCFDPDYKPASRRKSRRRARKIDLWEYVGGSWVYFIGNSRGAVKIGTTVNLPARLKKLQTGSSSRLQVLACVSGGAALESEYHERFSALKVNGEWFRGGEIRDEIARLRGAALSNLSPRLDNGHIKNGRKPHVFEW